MQRKLGRTNRARIIIFAIMLIIILGGIGFCAASAHTSESTASATTIITNFQQAFNKKFTSVSSFFCSQLANGGGCPPVAQNAIGLSPLANDGPPREVAGYHFFVSPYETAGVNAAATELDIDTQTMSSTQAVEKVLTQQIVANKLKTTTAKLRSSAEPSFSGTTYYNNNTLCMINSEAGSAGGIDGRSFGLRCASIASYRQAAAEVEPLYQAYLAANHNDTAKQLEFAPDSAPFTTASKTLDYKRGSAVITHVLGDQSGTLSATSLFYAKDNVWHFLVSNQSLWKCADPFPNQDAHVAYAGAFCTEPIGILSTVQ
jgi:hypothetical protein